MVYSQQDGIGFPILDFEDHLFLGIVDDDHKEDATLTIPLTAKDPTPPQVDAMENVVVAPPPPAATCHEDPTNLIAEKLQLAVQVMSSKVDQLQHDVLQVTRVRSVMEKARLQALRPVKNHEAGGLVKNHEAGGAVKNHEAGNVGNKKVRLFDAARSQAVKQKKVSELFRLCGNILRQLMQHRLAWPFLQPVDVDLLQLKDYYKVIRRPMDLGSIRKRLKLKDGPRYQHVQEFCEDVRLVFRNAMLYNDSSSEIYKMAKILSQKFEKKWTRTIESRLHEEEEKYDSQQDILYQNIVELHAQEEQAALQLGEDVIRQLKDTEKNIEFFLTRLLSKCRPMSTGEKRELHERVRMLPSASLGRVLEILSMENNFNGMTDNVQINFDALDSSTLWRLHFFVKMITEFNCKRAEGRLDI